MAHRPGPLKRPDDNSDDRPDGPVAVYRTAATAWHEHLNGDEGVDGIDRVRIDDSMPAGSAAQASTILTGSDDRRDRLEATGPRDASGTRSTNGVTTALIVLANQPYDDADNATASNAVVDLAIAAWIRAKSGRTGSIETHAAYTRTIHEFRAQVRARGMDLDAADPRRVRQHVLEQLAAAETLDDLAAAVDADASSASTASSAWDLPGTPADATEFWDGGSNERVSGSASAGDARARAVDVHGIRSELRRAVDLQARIDEEIAHREATLALAAQAYAAQPPRRAIRHAPDAPDTRHGSATSRADTHARADQHAQTTGGVSSVLVVAEDGAGIDRVRPNTAGAFPGVPPEVVAPTTYNRRLAIISSFYTYAHRHDLLRGRTNPISRVERRPAQAYAAARPLSYAAVQRGLAQATSDQPADLRDRALLLVGLHTGHRLSELWRMRLEHLTITPDTIAIEWPYCKGGKVMHSTLPLTRGGEGVAGRALLAWVEYLVAQHTGVDALPGGAPDAQAPHAAQTDASRPAYRPDPRDQRGHLRHSGRQKQTEGPLWVNLARNAAGLRPISKRTIATICGKRLGSTKVHSLRHTFARTLEDAGVKVSEIQQILGHQDLGTTGRYLARLRTQRIPHLDRVAELYGLQE